MRLPNEILGEMGMQVAVVIAALLIGISIGFGVTARSVDWTTDDAL